MRIPLTAHGRRELCLYGVPLLAASVVSAALGWYWLTAALAIVLVWMVSFFRDPHRAVPEGPKLLVSPADGRVTEITDCDDARVDGAAKRVSIFLSIFNVHINRAPCAGKVVEVTYAPGKKLNAMNPESARVNESNTIVLEGDDPAGVRVLVKQISGAIARRIVCTCAPGATLARGERFGMIKFGSRTDLYVSAERLVEITVAVGDRVKAGKTVIGVLK